MCSIQQWILVVHYLAAIESKEGPISCAHIQSVPEQFADIENHVLQTGSSITSITLETDPIINHTRL